MSFKWWPIRRTVQFSVIALIASPLAGFSFFRGNLAAGELLGIEFADPVAFLQAALASRVFIAPFFGAALIITTIYFLTGGRTFCSWICPVHLLTEMSDRLRRRLGTAERIITLSGIRWSLAMTIAVTVITGIPLFETVSPIGITSRAIMFRSLLPLLLVAAILMVEVCISRRVWCRSLCPVGGFYSLLGGVSPLRIGFAPHLCTHCGECSRICPVEEVLEPSLADNRQQVTSGDCTRCGDCIDICPTRALDLTFRYK